MILSAVGKALGQMTDPVFRRVLVWTLLLTIVIFIFLSLGVDYGVGRETHFSEGWLNFTTQLTTWVLWVLAIWFLFPLVATAIMGLFLDDAAEAVERQHYPADPPGIALGMGAAFWEALKLGLVILGVNILALPLYIAAFFVPPFGPLFVYYVINGYLLGREYFELVALRHLRPKEAHALRRSHRGGLVFYGLPIAIAFSIPFLNLLAPLFGTAYMVHIFKGLQHPNDD
jgi:CysZ protein